MASAEETIRTIEHNLEHMHAYSFWTIGLTNAPERREMDLEYPGFWRAWPADSMEDAQQIKAHFVERGMKPDPDEQKAGLYIYLF